MPAIPTRMRPWSLKYFLNNSKYHGWRTGKPCLPSIGLVPVFMRLRHYSYLQNARAFSNFRVCLEVGWWGPPFTFITIVVM